MTMKFARVAACSLLTILAAGAAMAARSTLPDRDSPSSWRDEVEELVELVGLLAEPAIHANRTA